MYFKVGLLFIIALFTRLFGFNWGGGFFFQPDENNMVMAIQRFTPSTLNPHFFAYGQFPLYLAYFTDILFRLPQTFTINAYTLRIWSAIFSVLTLLLIYIIANITFGKKSGWITLLLSIFTPGLIQLAHFGTTESLLIFVMVANLYLSVKLYKSPHLPYLYFIGALVSGIGLASKLSALIFIFPLCLVSLVNFFKDSQKLHIAFYTSYFLLFTLIFYCLLSPYNLINRSEFLSALNYETGVATGSMPVFYTTQFTATPAYLFQLIKIFPYALGLPIYLFGTIGVFIFILKKSKQKFVGWLFLAISSIYFIYFGQLYVKWTRFMSPLFVVFPFFATYFIAKIKNRWLLITVLLISIWPGINFIRLYFVPDIRVTATEWLNSHISSDSKILSEGGNVIDIPLKDNHYPVFNFDFYTLENSPQSFDKLVEEILSSNYILVPSRRVFKNQFGSSFPTSTRYYQSLFSGELGFTLVKTFYQPTFSWLSPEEAEETWTVFDRPTIRLYQKTRVLEKTDYENILKTPNF